MEFLFIIFVIYMIFSAVARGLRAAAAQKKPSQFPQQESERDFPVLSVDEDTRPTAEPAASVWPEYLYPDEPLLRQEAKVDQKPYVTGQRREAAIREKQPNRKEDSPRGARSQQRQVSRAYHKTEVRQTGPKLGLEQLLRDKNLPLAIIAGEVLGAPRSKKPFSQRNR